MARPARELHPGSWWLWALGLATTASLVTNPLLLLLLIAVASVVVSARRSEQPWGASFRLYLVLASVIVIVRVLFQVIINAGPGIGADDTVLLHLPEVPLPHWVLGIHLLGDVTRNAVLSGLYDGLRLATIVVCAGAANALANPKRLLKSLPPALYEVGTALVVAVSILPQLAESLSRVRRARQLRGVPGGRLARVRGIVVPVLEDALERSLALAAGMDARGYGRAGDLSRRDRAITGTLMLASLCGISVGAYGLLDQSVPRWLGTPMLVLGVLAAGLGLWSAGRRVVRTRYRPDRWRTAEIAVALSGIAVAAGIAVFVTDPVVRDPLTSSVPTVPGVALLVVLIGALPAVLAPPARINAGVTTELVA